MQESTQLLYNSNKKSHLTVRSLMTWSDLESHGAILNSS